MIFCCRRRQKEIFILVCRLLVVKLCFSCSKTIVLRKRKINELSTKLDASGEKKEEVQQQAKRARVFKKNNVLLKLFGLFKV